MVTKTCTKCNIEKPYSDFSKATRSITLTEASSDFLQIYDISLELLIKNSIHLRPIRLLGIGVSNLLSNETSSELVPSNKKIGTQLSFEFC